MSHSVSNGRLTAIATGMSPAALIDILSTVFSRFDRASADHGLEKIKDDSDAYMVAGGLPEASGRKTRRGLVADLALEC